MSIAQTVFERTPRFSFPWPAIRRMFPRCENHRCTRKGDLWPVVRHRSSGIQLDGRWLCGPSCFEASVSEMLARTVPYASRWKPKMHRVPIGLVLLSRGTIREDQLREALELQRQTGKRRLGAWLQETGAATEDDITLALAAQWACPIFPLATERSFLECANLLPMAVVRSARMLPVYLSRDRSSVFIAFVDGVDHSWLRSAEEILGCRTVPCIVAESAFNRALKEISFDSRAEEFLFESATDVREMSRITTSFAMQLRADWVRMVGCREFAWARFHSEEVARDLLFRLPVAS